MIFDNNVWEIWYNYVLYICNCVLGKINVFSGKAAVSTAVTEPGAADNTAANSQGSSKTLKLCE